jgi:integrase/recombinase XerD
MKYIVVNTKPEILLSKDSFNDKKVICIRFKNNQQVIDRLKKVTTAVWSASLSYWCINQDDFNLRLFFKQFRDIAYIDYSALKKIEIKQQSNAKHHRDKYDHRNHLNVPDKYLENLEQKRYSSNTIKTYVAYFKDFMYYFSTRKLKSIEKDEINGYILLRYKLHCT